MNINTLKKIDSLIPEKGPADPDEIRAALMLAQTTQSEIAALCKCSRTCVNDVITGKQNIYDVASQISIVLSINLQRLFGDRFEYAPRQRKETWRKAA